MTPEWKEILAKKFHIANQVDFRRKNQFWWRVHFSDPFEFLLEVGPTKLGWVCPSNGEWRAAPITRITTNPAKSEVDARRLYDLLTAMYGGIDGLFLRRVDLKFDDPTPLADWLGRVILSGARKVRRFRPGSLYLGSFHSKHLLIYDKGLETLQRTGKNVGILTRLEMRYRFPYKKVPLLNLFRGEIPIFENVQVFDGKHLYRNSELESRLRWYLQHGFSLAEGLSRFSRSTAKDLRKRLFDPDGTQTLRNHVRKDLTDYLAVIQDDLDRLHPTHHEKEGEMFLDVAKDDDCR